MTELETLHAARVAHKPAPAKLPGDDRIAARAMQLIDLIVQDTEDRIYIDEMTPDWQRFIAEGKQLLREWENRPC